MTAMERIKSEVARLSAKERAELARWFLEIEAEAWDREIEADAEAGKLDFLAEEALREYEAGKTREL